MKRRRRRGPLNRAEIAAAMRRAVNQRSMRAIWNGWRAALLRTRPH